MTKLYLVYIREFVISSIAVLLAFYYHSFIKMFLIAFPNFWLLMYFSSFVMISVSLLLISYSIREVLRARLINKLEKLSTDKEVYSVINYKSVYLSELDFFVALQEHKLNKRSGVILNISRYDEFKEGDCVKYWYDDSGEVQLAKVVL